MTDWDLVVVGGGPGGLSCGMFAARSGLRTCLVEADTLGGQLVLLAEVADLPGTDDAVAGWDLGAILAEQAQDAGVAVRFGEVTSLARVGAAWRVAGAGVDLTAAVVAVAAGSSEMPLGVPGERELRGSGVSSCAGCDGPLFQGEPVAVVGGDLALHEAAVLSRWAGSVLVLLPGPSRATGWARRTATALPSNVALVPSARVVEILGDAAVTGVRYVDRGGTEVTASVRAVFLATERSPRSSLLHRVARLDDRGAVETDASLRTHAPGLLALGDVRAGSPRRVAAAIGDGCQAAVTAARLLGGSAPGEERS